MCAERLSARAGRWACLVIMGLFPVGQDGRAGEAPATSWVLGRVEPRAAQGLHVPPGAPDRAGPLILLRSVPDGARVKAGDELAAFAFDADRLGAAAVGRVRRAEARAERALAQRQERIRALEADKALAAIEVRKANLDKRKAGVLSKRDAALVELAARQAAFELKALERRIVAQTRLLEAERARFAVRIVSEREGLERVAVLAGRHRLVAPGAGRIHWLGPVPVGTRLQPGDPIALFAPGEGLEAVIQVPARTQADYTPGRALTVTSLSADVETYARVTPGTWGLARRDATGAAWIQIRAELPADARGFRVGQVVRVGP